MTDLAGVASKLASRLDEWLEAFDRFCPFTDEQRDAHVATIAQRRALGSVAAALADDAFLRRLYRTLELWGIGARGSRLPPFPAFVAALQERAAELAALEPLADRSADARAGSRGRAPRPARAVASVRPARSLGLGRHWSDRPREK